MRDETLVIGQHYLLVYENGEFVFRRVASNYRPYSGYVIEVATTTQLFVASYANGRQERVESFDVVAEGNGNVFWCGVSIQIPPATVSMNLQIQSRESKPRNDLVEKSRHGPTIIPDSDHEKVEVGTLASGGTLRTNPWTEPE